MEITAEKRTEFGKKAQKLRTAKKLPGVIFGKNFSSLPITLDYIKFEKAFKKAGETTIIDLKVGGEDSYKTIISEVDIHPVTGKYIHANFHKVNLKEKITAEVPVKIVGEAPAVKDGIGLLLVLIHDLTLEALPTDLPHDIRVDVSGLSEIDQAITIKDLPIDREKVEIKGQHDDELVVKIAHALMKEEEVVAEPVSEAELIAKVEVTEQLSEEEKAKKAAEDKAKKEKEEK